MANPLFVDIYRGTQIESRHRGSFAVVDATGKLIDQAGDIKTPVFPRSAIKALQALPLFETGAAKRFNFTHEELALMISSHGGEKPHVKIAKQILAKAAQDETCLECGAHHPMYLKAAYELAKTGKNPSALHNNCSGKHAGFVCLATQLETNIKGYIEPTHLVQKTIKAAIENIIAYKLENTLMGIDGCSIPTFAAPLTAWARGFAALIEQEAGKRMFEAAFAAPFYVAGSQRYCTNVMTHLKGLAFVKTGAEGVFCASLPTLGLGIALKCDDGATRGAEAMMTMLLQKYFPAQEDLFNLLHPVMTNWNGRVVGQIRAV